MWKKTLETNQDFKAGACQRRLREPFSIAHGIARRWHAAMIRTEKCICLLPTCTFLRSLADNPRRPMGRARDLRGPVGDPIRPRRAVDHEEQGVPNQIAQTNPNSIHRMRTTSTRSFDKSWHTDSSSSNERAAYPSALADDAILRESAHGKKMARGV